MFKTKRDVDAHVNNLLRRLKDDKEKKNRGYSVAKLYLSVDEYDMAERYLAGYLSIKPTFHPAHNLMGEIHERQKKFPLALDSFKKSFCLDATQKNVVYSICKILTQMDDVDNDTIKPWLDRAESVFPKSDPKSSVIFQLREKMIKEIQNRSAEKGIGQVEINGESETQLQALYAEELVKRPHDVSLRVKLLQMLVEEGKIDEAKEHAFNAEAAVSFHTGPANLFLNSVEWYAAIVDILEVERSTKCTLSSTFYLDYLHSLCLLTSLRLKESPALAAKCLHKLDQALYEAENLEADPGASRVSGNEAALWQVFLKEMRAQFFSLSGSLFLARAVADQLPWTDALHYSSMCYLVSYSQDPPNLKAPFYPQSSPRLQKRLQLWYSLACFRLSVSGYTLLSHVSSSSSSSKKESAITNFCNKIRQSCSEPRRRDSLYDSLFDLLKSQPNRRHSSFLLNSSLFASFTLRLPNASTIRGSYDPISHLLNPDDLSFLVWFALQQHKIGSKHASAQQKHGFEVFKALPLVASAASVANNPSRPESLCQLDTEAFLYATVHVAATTLNKGPTSLNVSSRVSFGGGRGRVPSGNSTGPPPILPPNIGADLQPICTPRQAEWWSAAYKLTTNNVKGSFSNVSLFRQTLQRGIETVRGMTAHGLDLSMIIHLAKTFQARTQESWKEESAEIVGGARIGFDASVVTNGVDPEIADMIGPGVGEESAAYQDRALLYWTMAIDLLKKMNKNQYVQMPKERLFVIQSTRELSADQIDRLIEEGNFFIALTKLKSGENLEEAVKELSTVSTAEAAFHTAHAFKEIAKKVSETGDGGNTAEIRQRRSDALKSALDSLFLTMDRTRGNPEHPLNDVLADEIKEVEKLLGELKNGNKSSLNLTNGHHNGAAEPDESYNSEEDSFYEDVPAEATDLGCFALGASAIPSSTPMKEVGGNTSRGSRNAIPDATIELVNHKSKNQIMQAPHVRPSPERLDAEIRSIKRDREQHTQQMESQAKQIALLLEAQAKQEKRNTDMMEEIQSTKKHILELYDFFKTFAANLTPQHGQVGMPGVGGGGSLTGTPVQSRFGNGTSILGTPTAAAGGPSIPLSNSFYDPSILPPPVNPATVLQNPNMPPLASGGGLIRTPSPANFGLVGSPAARLFTAPGPQVNVPTPPSQLTTNNNANTAVHNELDDDYYDDYDEEEEEEDDDRYWVEDEEEEGHQNHPCGPIPKHVEPPSMIPDNAPCDYPYGQITSMQGRSTITYQAPTSTPSVPAAAPAPAVTVGSGGASNFGPGFFSNTAATELSTNFFSASKSASPALSGVSASDGGSATPSISLPLKNAAPPSAEAAAAFVRQLAGNDRDSKAAPPNVVPTMAFTTPPPNVVAPVTTPAGTPTPKPFSVNFNPNAVSKIATPPPPLPPASSATSTKSNGTFSIASGKPILEPSPEKTKEPGGGFAIALSPDSINNQMPSVFNTGSGVASTILQSKEDAEDGSEGGENEIDPMPDFKPIVQLDEVEVKTGEEEEEVLFSERAKLFRFAESGEWKERGLGPIKILKSKAGKYRLLMRREQIHKVCLNHGITRDGLALRQMESNDKAWLWAALDFAESVEGTYEKFCLRFKTKDIGLEFKQGVDDAVDQLNATDEEETDANDAGDAYEEEGEDKEEGEDEEEAEEEDKPESEKDQIPTQETTADALATETEKKVAPATSIFGSAATTKPLSFADLLNSNSDSSPGSGFKCDPSFKFPGVGTSVFKSPVVAAPERDAPDLTVESKGEDEADAAGSNEAEDYEPEVDFKPVVPLPDLVEVKTGEEEEEVLYQHRAKLFRYAAETKEFKERGLGDIKILKHKVTGKVRVILRREQILKLACNFNLTPGIELKPMSTSDKAFQWICMDYSEEELTQEGLAVKFKTEDIAAGFKQAWKDAVAGLEKTEKEKTPISSSDSKKDEAGFKACEGAAKGFGNMFKPEAGSWECPGCMTRNGPDVDSCPCCNTANPTKAAAEPKPAAVLAPPATSGFGDAFKPKAGSWECGGCYTRNGGDVSVCPCCNTPNPNAPADAAAPAPPPSLASKLGGASLSGGFTFGGSPSSGGFSFGSKTPLTASTPSFGTAVPLGSDAGKTASGFTFGTTSTPKSSTSSTPVFGAGPIKFGVSAPPAETTTTASPKPAAPVFGTPSSTGSMFGKPSNTPSDPATPVKPIFGVPATTAVTSTPPNTDVPSIFGGTAKSPPSTFVIGGDKSEAPKPAFNLGGFTFGSSPVVKTLEEKTENKKEDTKSEEKEAAPQTGLFTAFKGFGNAAAASPVSFSSIFSNTAKTDDNEEAEGKATSVTTATATVETSAPTTTSSWAPPSTVFSFSTNKSLFSLGRSNSQSSLADSENEAEEAPKPTFATPSKLATSTATFVPPSNSSFSFGAAAAENSGFSFTIKPVEKKESEKIASPVKGKVAEEEEDGEDSYYKEEEGDHIHFEPIVPLPDKVEVKTGEEDEEEIFAERSKLFRFTDGEWKERGLGIMKILKNPITGRYRLLMRREQVLKICCNHLLGPEIVLCPMANSDKAWVWHASDASEEEVEHLRFALKLKNADIANEFKSHVDRITKEAALNSSAASIETPPSSPGPVEPRQIQSPVVSSSSSDCQVVDEVLPEEDLVALAEKYQLPKSFYNYLTKPPCPGCVGCEDENGVSSTTDSKKDIKKEISTVENGETSEKEEDTNGAGAVNGEADISTSIFGGNSSVFGGSTFSFADLAKKSPGGGFASQSASQASGFGFAGLGSTKPVFASMAKKNEDDEGEDDEEPESHDPHFEPIVPLPDLVEVKTGEEGNVVLFNSRSKLYRFDGAWKERGTGEMKLLKNPDSGRVRVLMRREQIHKVVCNHLISGEMKLTPLSTSESAICWYANDFSEGADAKKEQFACRFKNKEICDDFKSIFESAAEAENGQRNEDDEEEEQQDSETESNNGY